MAKQIKQDGARVLMLVGLGDFVLGLLLAGLAFSGVLGPDLNIVAVLGLIMAVVGAGLALWGRSKIQHANTRGGRN